MHLLYTISIHLFELSIRVASLFNPKAKEWVKGRKHYFSHLTESAKPVLWFHCASLGEFDMAIPVMHEMRVSHPNHTILVTFFSPSGMQHYHKRNHPADLVLYLPIDTKKNAKRFVSHFKPEKAFFVKYEFWANYLDALKNSGTSVFSICTLLRPDHRFFRWYGGFFRRSLRMFDHFYVQNESTSELLHAIGIRQVTITGDTRYDKVIETRDKRGRNPRIEEFLQGQQAVIFGSTWPQDEAIILPWIETNPTIKCIIAPHNIDAAHVQSLEKAFGERCIRFTEKDIKKCQVLILDTIGHLSSAYESAKIAYVGGGFSGKLHNILEPAVYGIPVLFGPKFNRFPEAQEFIDAGIGFSVSDTKSLSERITDVTSRLSEIKAEADALIQQNAGAAVRIAEHQQLNFPA
jgi:3-deoxy-D-manno-octulosonic-acid transferase